jgi:carboxyl-terminal processing protease
MPRRNILTIAMVGAITLPFWQDSQAAKPKDEVMELYGVFVDAVEMVEMNYVRPVSRKDLLEGALRGMLQELDPHSSYINTGQMKNFRRQIEGKFGGIGIQVNADPEVNRLKVISPMVGTPAYNAGVLAGDTILKIDDTTTEGMGLDKAIELLQGRPGTTVRLEVLHEGIEKVENISLARAIIDLPSVYGNVRKDDDSWDFMLDHDKKVGYIRITNFMQNTTEEVKHALEDLKAQDMKGLILDLRDDPGGLLSSAVEISDLFLEEGQIVSTKGRNTAPKTFDAEKEGTYSGFPMAVLVNQNSASASEIVSAALQDHDRATVVGQRSFGKGSVQNILDLEDGNSFLKLTVATYWRPSGKNIHRFKEAKDSDEWGVSPNKGYEVKYSPEEYYSWAVDRRDRDQASSHNKPKAPKVDAPADKPKEDAKADESKPKEAEKGKPAPNEDNPAKEAGKLRKPFVDRQLAKALEFVSGKMVAAK